MKTEPEQLPFLTADLPPVQGAIKQRPQDFFVEEIPLYQPCGTGTHIYAFIEKQGITTTAAITRIAKAMGVRRIDVGYAGRKDARAVTRQWLSIEHADPQKLAGLDFPDLKILRVERHTNKLKIGHLSANRFVIMLRSLSLPAEQALTIAQTSLEVLQRRGAPNYFGPQRFGSRYESHLFGCAIIKGRIDEFFDIFLGQPENETNPQAAQMRNLYSHGDYEEAYRICPKNLSDHKRALALLSRHKGSRQKAFNNLDRWLKRLFVAAWQSDLFNKVLAARMPAIDCLLDGDMAIKHDNGACFKVENAAAEQPRCSAFQISPTGPLYAERMTVLTGAAGEIENSILRQTDLNEDDFKRLKKLGCRGGRRPLRFQPKNISLDCGKDNRGDYLRFAFELDSGCYATTLLREITKTDLA